MCNGINQMLLGLYFVDVSFGVLKLSTFRSPSIFTSFNLYIVNLMELLVFYLYNHLTLMQNLQNKCHSMPRGHFLRNGTSARTQMVKIKSDRFIIELDTLTMIIT